MGSLNSFMYNIWDTSFAKDAKIFWKLTLVLDNSFIMDINEGKLFESISPGLD